ncbi:MAG: alpha-1,2-fucosyltransferase [Candidatus Marinimicrobia bacterium]|nr:alpha-1,2-fucosyltransferase [candidate division WOR-3 bacterium]MCK4445850.1 alpha-1,2-fucosyltransferase [Candidatus Neomarinimicrobiota bacterium]
MIIVKIYGGLGNQLFQYAFVRAISLECNREFGLDISWFDKQIGTTNMNLPDKKEYLLNNFKIIEIYSSPIVSLVIWLISKVTNKIKILNKISKLFLLNKYWPLNISESEYKEYDNHEICRKKLLLLNGYWQNFRYFEKYENIIRKEFTLRHKPTDENEEYLNKILSSNSVSLHFRRGDVLKPYALKIYYICSMDYYLKSISYMSEKVHNPIFFVFSNDIQWVKSNLKISYPAVFIESQGPDYEHFFLMSQCKHNIIANSTFSWWGAWLNKNPDKIVIGPKKWFKDPIKNKVNKDLIPNSWIRI